MKKQIKATQDQAKARLDQSKAAAIDSGSIGFAAPDISVSPGLIFINANSGNISNITYSFMGLERRA
ncbi:MAG: hypothetical protein Q8O63_12125 [Hoeflea sp.]|nr:hypothetical protein [Hoeflea sp.]